MEKLDTNEFRELTTEEIGMVSGGSTQQKVVVYNTGCNVDWKYEYVQD